MAPTESVPSSVPVRMVFNVPIALTWLRIVLIPVFVGVYYLPNAWLSPVGKNWTAMAVFALAAITDWLDGYLARKLGETSAFGAFLDPVADKLMVAAALIMLVWLDRAEAYLAMIIIGREIAISALREWMAQLGKGKSVAVDAWCIENNHGRSVKVVAPPVGGIKMLMRRIAERVGANKNQSLIQLADSLHRAFNANRILIVD